MQSEVQRARRISKLVGHMACEVYDGSSQEFKKNWESRVPVNRSEAGIVFWIAGKFLQTSKDKDTKIIGEVLDGFGESLIEKAVIKA